MLIDTHAHVNFKDFREDADEVIRRALEENTWMVLVGSEYKTSKRAIEIANRYQRGVYAAVGLHPVHCQELDACDEEYDFKTSGEEFNFEMYEQLSGYEKVVAIGEVGLDYYHISHDNITVAKQKQKELFISQLDLAREQNLPVIVHCRQAHDDMIAILKDYRKEHKPGLPSGRPWGVMHCFSGDENLAWEYFNLGFLVSFTGIITFSKQWDDLVRKLPYDRFMIETDCPYMTPEPFRGKRNEPLLVRYVAQRIAEIKGVPIEKIAETSTENARGLFRI